MRKPIYEPCIGDKFGYWEVISDQIEKRGKGSRYIKCQCTFNNCGRIKYVYCSDLIGQRSEKCICCANSGKTKTHGMSRTRIYGIWNGIVTRCTNPNHKDYINYGGIGISMCEEWRNSFEKFYEWAIKNGYKDGLEVDRQDSKLGYSPDNCRICTRNQNIYNCGSRKISSSQYKGVHKPKGSHKWKAQIQIDGINHNLGLFDTEIEAAKAYNTKAKELFGEFAYLNKIEDNQ